MDERLKGYEIMKMSRERQIKSVEKGAGTERIKFMAEI